MTTPAVAALAQRLAAIDAPEDLFALAATAHSLAVTDRSVGALYVTHLTLLALARRSDDALGEAEWHRTRIVCARLADLLELGTIETLDVLGGAWLDLTRPEALQ